MGVMLGFAPWILYWVLVANDTFEEAAAAGLVASGVLFALGLAYRRKPKILEIGTLVWFAALVLVGLSADEKFFADWSHVLSNAALAAIMLVSILVGHPFARQYGHDTVPQEFWNSPVFLKSTLVISWAWFGAMVVMGVSSALTRQFPSEDLWLDWIIPIGAIVAAIKFTQRYPDSLKQQHPPAALPIFASFFVSYGRISLDVVGNLVPPHLAYVDSNPSTGVEWTGLHGPGGLNGGPRQSHLGGREMRFPSDCPTMAALFVPDWDYYVAGSASPGP